MTTIYLNRTAAVINGIALPSGYTLYHKNSGWDVLRSKGIFPERFSLDQFGSNPHKWIEDIHQSWLLLDFSHSDGYYTGETSPEHLLV
jgi:hypothetical protein